MISSNFQPEVVSLSNGIPVLLQQEESPVSTLYWWVKTGSADESEEQAGFAHFLEHMLFKDSHAKASGKSSEGKTARLIESLGGDINAYTSLDQTVYHVTCAATHFLSILKVFGEMVQPKKFLKEDFLKEKEVVLEELRRDLDSPGSQLFHELFATTFRVHPYGKPVIGSEKILKKSTLSQLQHFYQTHYTSDKMGLILVGPLGDIKKQILESLEKFFGSFQVKKKHSSARSSLYRPTEPPCRKNPSWKMRGFDVKTPTFAISFRIPELNHPDIPVLDLICQTLCGGELSWLYQSLFYEKSLVTDVSGGLYVPKDPGMLYFSIDFAELQDFKKIVNEFLLQIEKIQKTPPTASECERIYTQFESDRLYSRQTVDRIAGRLGFLHFVTGNPNFDQGYLEVIKNLPPDQICQVAKKYFQFQRWSAVLLSPQEKNKEAEVLLKEVIQETRLRLQPTTLFQTSLSVFPSASSNKPITSSKNKKHLLDNRKPVNKVKLPSGIQVCYQYRPQSPVFSVHASFLGGVRLELAAPIERAETDWGSSHLLALTWTQGTEKRNLKNILEITEGKAAQLEGFSGRNATGLQMTGLARDWKILSDLFTEVFVFPSFPLEELEHSKRMTEDSIRGIEDHSAQVCSQLFLQTLFTTHPYGRISYGSLSSVKKILPEKLRAFHRAWARPERLVLSLSGPLSESEWRPWVEDLEASLTQTLKDRNPSPLHLPEHLEDEPTLKNPRWTGKKYARAQHHFLVGGLGIQIHSPDHWPLLVLNTLLEGQSGRLFIELREKRSLAYTVSPVHFEGLERGYLGTYIACSPEKGSEALKGIQAVFEKLAEKGPLASELKRVHQYLLGKQAMELQSDASIAAFYGLETLYQIPILSMEEFSKKIQEVTEKDIVRVCEKYYINSSQVTCEVG